MKVGLVHATVEDAAGLVEITRAKERGLLGLLALAPGRIVSVDRLIDGLWGDDPPRTAAKTLQTYVKNLRGHIASCGAPRDTLRTDPPGYLLAIDPNDVDLLRFEQQCQAAATAAQAGSAAEADRLYTQALSTVTQTDFVAFDAPGLEGAVVRFVEHRRRARDEHVDVLLELGRHGDLVGPLSERVESEPGHERSWAQLMIALYRSDRQRDALHAFGTARDRMRDDFGLEPGPALVELEAQILRHDVPAAGHTLPNATLAIAVTMRTADGSTGTAAAHIDRVLEPAAALERGPTQHGYRVVLGAVDAAALLAYRLRRHDPNTKIVAVREGSENEDGQVASLLASESLVVFADDIAAPLARRRWTRLQSGWSPPDVPAMSLRVPSALEQVRDRVPAYVDRGMGADTTQHLAAVMNGERRALRVSGPAGIGKSSWLAHAAQTMTAQGCAVLYGRASATATTSHEPLIDAAYQAVVMLDRIELEAHVAGHGLVLASIVPEIQSLVGAPTVVNAASAAGAEVNAALVDLFQRLARNVPTMLLIDDAPWLTEESVRVLQRLLSDQRGAAVGLIVTCRTEDPATPPLAPELSDVSVTDPVDLNYFTVDQTARFLESTAAIARSPRTLQVAELVNQTTLGLPLFVREMAHDLARSSDWLTPAGKFRIDKTPENISLPSSLHDLLRQRLDLLDSEAQTLALVGAVFGEFSTLLVATVSELPIIDVLSALDRLIDQRVIEPIAGLADHYQFAHPLLREAALQDVGTARTAAIALAAAEYLSIQPNPTARQLDRRAELWFRAIPLAPIDRVEAELDAAATAAFGRGDHRQQMLHLRRRIDITESVGQDVPIKVRVWLAEASVKAQVEASLRRQRARAAFQAAHAAAEPELAARSALAFAGPFNPFGSLVSVDDESEFMARQALGLGVVGVGLQAELWGMVAAARSDVTGPATEIVSALELAAQASDPLVHGRLLSLAHALESAANPVPERLARNRQIIATAEKHGDRSLELQGWGWMVADAFEAGEVELMNQAALNRASLADRLDDTTYRWSDLVYQGMRAMVSGRFSDADATLWQALEVGRLPLGDHANRFFGLQLLKLSEMRGQGEPMLAPAQAYADQLGYVTAYVSLAHLHVELGNFDQAGELIEQHVPNDLGELLSTYDRLPTLALLARIAQLRNDTNLAARVSRELVPSVGQLCVHADAVLYGSVAHNLGRCALTTGDGASALDWLDRSQQIYDDLDARAWLLLLESDRCGALELQDEHEQAMPRRAKLTIEANEMGLALRTAS